ncbi:MAG: toxin [Elusimicrobiota bacterium]
MKLIVWNYEKNEWLKVWRGVSFEQVLLLIEDGKILDIIEHKNKKKYPNQRVIVVEIANYVYSVPFVETKKEIFLKTIFPDRKLTKNYLKRGE